MQYLITTKTDPPFFTKWFEEENNFNSVVEMVVYDLYKEVYTTDGINWMPIEEDHL